MRCDRRVLVVRAWLLLLAVPWLLPLFGFWTFYAATLVVFGLMMPVLAAPDCGSSTGACNGGTKPSSASVTFSGYASAVCGTTHNCTERNSTFVATYNSDQASSCKFVYSSFVCAFGFGGTTDLTVLILHNATHTRVNVNTSCANGTTATAWDDTTNLAGSPTDCLAFGTVSPALTDNSCFTSSGVCDATGVTIGVVFS